MADTFRVRLGGGRWRSRLAGRAGVPVATRSELRTTFLGQADFLGRCVSPALLAQPFAISSRTQSECWRWNLRKLLRFEIIPHPHHRDEWLLKPTRRAPFGLWYRERAHAVSYAEWIAREVDCAEILIRNTDGSVERRVVERPS